MLTYRKAVGAIISNHKQQIWLGQRKDHPQVWQPPQGGIDLGEETRTALLRELKEEIGTNKVEIISEVAQLSYDFPAEVQAKMRYKGQSITWFLVKLLAPDSEISIDSLDFPQEFVNWRWGPLEELTHLQSAFKQQMYNKLYHILLAENPLTE